MASHSGPESGTIWGAEGLGGFLPFGQQTVFGYRDVVPPDVAVLWSSEHVEKWRTNFAQKGTRG
ncbi:hypothetical protein GN958_ATG18468 [Phytophthora infestans]|uniref:Uncharacterized protein n=1 Tax=Phytophthora infestans TaxID=4787 RepID=A0A8S9TUF9_PHYIN|nr:hypothetical protein GN958_ATG18468 [Phytophthora infestans]